jgi:hypothetical protein
MKLAALLVILCAIPLSAIEIELPFTEVVADARSIVLARVVASNARWQPGRAGRPIATDVEFAVERVYKGPAMAQATLRFPGGSIGGVALNVEAAYRFEPGQRVVLFVAADTEAADPLVGGPQGLYRVAVNARTKAESVRPSFDEGAAPIPLDEFEARITRLVHH